MTDDLITKTKDEQEKGVGVSKAMLKTITESPLTHSVVWFVLTIIFGLIQTWIIFFYHSYRKGENFSI